MDLETKFWGALTIVGLASLISLEWLPGLLIFGLGAWGLVVRGSSSDTSL